MIDNLLLVLVVFSGCIGGYLLALIAPEELRPGYKNLVLFRNISYSAFVGLLSFFFIKMFVFPLLISVLVLFLLSKKDILVFLYWISGFGLWVVRSSDEFLMSLSILLFLVGMSSASFIAVKYEKKEKIKGKSKLLFDILKQHVLFIIISIVPFIIGFFI